MTSNEFTAFLGGAIGSALACAFTAIIVGAIYGSRCWQRGWNECAKDAKVQRGYASERHDKAMKFRDDTIDRLHGEMSDLIERNAELRKSLDSSIPQENINMARKPLTAEQLEVCKAANGMECPRCSEDEDTTIDEIDVKDGVPFQLLSCDKCGQSWRVYYSANSVQEITKGSDQ